MAKLTPSDGPSGFGDSISISGNTAIVGAYSDNDLGTYSGSAYVFRNTGSGWTQVAKLTASDGGPGDFFGFSVSIQGTTAIIGATWDGDLGEHSGSAYVFEETGSGWTQVAKLTASDGAAYEVFGGSVSLSGSTVIVGACDGDFRGEGPGAAYVFEDNGSDWVQVAKLTAADNGEVDVLFGISVSINGTTAVVGADRDDDHGAVRVRRMSTRRRLRAGATSANSRPTTARLAIFSAAASRSAAPR